MHNLHFALMQRVPAAFARANPATAAGGSAGAPGAARPRRSAATRAAPRRGAGACSVLPRIFDKWGTFSAASSRVRSTYTCIMHPWQMCEMRDFTGACEGPRSSVPVQYSAGTCTCRILLVRTGTGSEIPQLYSTRTYDVHSTLTSTSMLHTSYLVRGIGFSRLVTTHTYVQVANSMYYVLCTRYDVHSTKYLCTCT